MEPLTTEVFQEGKAEGRALGKAEAVIKILEVRFGPVSSIVEKRIYTADNLKLDRLLGRAVVVPSIKALFNDTDGNDRLMPEIGNSSQFEWPLKPTKDNLDAVENARPKEYEAVSMTKGMIESLLMILCIRFQRSIPGIFLKRIYAADNSELSRLLSKAGMVPSIEALFNDCSLSDSQAEPVENDLDAIEEVCLQEGEEIGITNGMIKSLLKVLYSRFGPIPITVAKRIYTADNSERNHLLGEAGVVPSFATLFNSCEVDDRLPPVMLNFAMSEHPLRKQAGLMTNTLVETWLHLGVDKGMDKAMVWSLLKVLDSRFGPVPDTVKKRIHAANNSELNRLLGEAGVVSSLDALFCGHGINDRLKLESRNPPQSNSQTMPVAETTDTQTMAWRQMGRVDGMAEVLRELLEVRFGSVPDAVEKRINAADNVEVLRLLSLATGLQSSQLSLLDFGGDDILAPETQSPSSRHTRRRNRQKVPKGAVAKVYYQEGYELGHAMARATHSARCQADQVVDTFLINAELLRRNLSEAEATLITFAPPAQIRDWFERLVGGEHPSEILEIWMPLYCAIEGWKSHIET